MSDGRCALLSAQLDEPLLGTAPEASVFLLVEVRGAWASKVLESDLPGPVRAFLADQEARHAGLRLQLIRTPRRLQGPLAVYLCRVGHFMSRVQLDCLDDLPTVDVGRWLTTGALPGAEAVLEPLTLVCTHGRRDVCCALLGNPLFDALASSRPVPDSDACPRVWQTSHLGGHRFAPVVLSLPDGHCYGRVGVDEAVEFTRAQATGHVHSPARLRGRTCDPPWLQAASSAARMATDQRAFDAFVPGVTQEAPSDGDSPGSTGAATYVTLSLPTGSVRVALRQETRPGALRPASCGDAAGPMVCWRADVAS